MGNADHPSLNIIEVCKVAPPPDADSPAPPSPLPLTFFDILWLRFHPVQRLFFYQTPPFADTASILQNLKSSLSLTLRHYLPLTGHITWPQHSPVPVIEFSHDDTVSLTVAESHADFHHLSSNGLRNAEEYHPLVPQLSVSHERAAVVALQITLFPNAGFSLGVTTHHAILDGSSSTSFLKLWARICTNPLSPTEPIDGPFYDRSVIKDPAGLTSIYTDKWLELGGPNNRSLSLLPPKTPPGLTWCTLELTRLDLEKLKQWVAKKKQPGVRVSSFVLTTAYLSVCTAKMKGSSADKIGIIFAMDARARLEPPVPSNYFGNCLVARPKFLESCELSGENGMVSAVEAISEAIKSVGEEGALKGAENLGTVIESVGSDDKTPVVSIGGSPRFGVYSTDFGWGKPLKVEIVSIEFTGAFSLTETGSGDGGIEIGFVRERNEVKSFVSIFAEGLRSL